jgi:hypothetical protein
MNIKIKKMIYKNIEKLVLNTPNNMELGEKIRELYWKESNEVGKRINLEDNPLTPNVTPIKGSYKDELPPSDYQLDN